MIDLANERGGPDNITVIVARFEGENLAEPEGDDAVGHQVFPLLDPESTTEPVPVYKGSPAPTPQNTAQLVVAVLLTAAMTIAALWYATHGL